jgi:UDP-N-acetylmuramyl pentapeptide phosphotransferase/UDP-N-acetylglucosamine-1-phosphate transferase
MPARYSYTGKMHRSWRRKKVCRVLSLLTAVLAIISILSHAAVLAVVMIIATVLLRVLMSAASRSWARYYKRATFARLSEDTHVGQLSWHERDHMADVYDRYEGL